MEVSVLEANNVPPKALIAVGSGSVRRQSNLNVGQKLLIPAKVTGGDVKIDVSLFEQLGTAQMPTDMVAGDTFVVPVTRADGKVSEVKLLARPSSPSKVANKDGDASSIPVPGLAPDTWKYLGQQDLQATVQSLLHEVCVDRPADPYEFMARRLKAHKESGNVAPVASPRTPAIEALLEGRASQVDIRANMDVLRELACETIMCASQENEDGKEIRMEAKSSARTSLTSVYNNLGSKPTVQALEDFQVSKIHSSIRWNKTAAEVKDTVKEVGADLPSALAAMDPKNGNQCLHIAAQNGHMNLLKFLIEQKADVNGQNGKGQTPLHMSIEYDFFFQSKVLLAAGAEPAKQNGDGHEALKGIDGTKIGKEAWDNPVTVLKAAGNVKEELDFALNVLEKADASNIDKGALAQTGMLKKKNCTANWDAARFMEIMKKV